jgi:hypothetical protein
VAEAQGQFGNAEERGTHAIERGYQKTGKDTAD